MGTSHDPTKPLSVLARPAAAIVRLLDARWIDRDRLDELFAARRSADELGTRVYVALACVFMVGISGPMSFAEFAGLPVAICFLIHIKRTFRIWSLAFVDPRFYLLVALAAWMAISLLWSGDARQGYEEFGALRWGWFVIMLYPVLDRRRLLLAAWVVGLLLGNASQLVHTLHDTIGVEIFARAPGRYSGWWGPVVAGSILCAALGLHLPTAMMGHGRARFFAISACVVTLAGIVATGTRGAWIASVMLVSVVGMVAILRVHPRRRALIPASIVAALLAITLSAAAWSLRDSALASRVATGFREVNAAISTGEFRSDTGARIYMNMRAAQAFAAHPIRGVGAGGFRPWVNMYDTAHNDISHAHAHSAPLHAAATLGLVGLTLMGLLLIGTFRSAIRACDDLGSYSAGPIFALLGLLLVGIFDTVQVNAQSAAQLAILIALCPPVLPTQFSRDRCV